MWKCNECEEWFDTPDYIEICYERECGVSSLFSDRHYTTVSVCPNCGSYCIEEADYEEEEDAEE